MRRYWYNDATVCTNKSILSVFLSDSMNLWRRFLTYQTLSSYTVPLNQPIMNYEWESLTRPLFLPQALVSTSLPLETSTLLPRLATLIGSLLYVYKSNHSIFTYYDNKLDFPNFTAFYDFVNVSASTILNINPSSSSSSSSSSKDVVGTESLQYYHYYSGNLMQEKLSPLRQFLDTGMWVRQLIKGRPVTALLWLGGKGVQASGHYDTVYNVFVHLAGVKVVRLVAPRYASQLGFFGRNHPHACQSRYADIKSRTLLNITYRCVHDRECAFSKESEGYGKVEEDDSENDHQFQIQEFTLRSGDVLFIPPFWTHEVCAMKSFPYIQ